MRIERELERGESSEGKKCKCMKRKLMVESHARFRSEILAKFYGFTAVPTADFTIVRSGCANEYSYKYKS